MAWTIWRTAEIHFSCWSLFIGIHDFFADDSVLRWISAKMEIRRQNAQMEQYQKEIREMDKQIKMLSTDRDTLEEFSRERFHFAAPGEDVYVYGDK